jgi:hypothetical protein
MKKLVRIIWRNSDSFSLKGIKSNLGDVLRISLAANDSRYQYLFCLDEKSINLYKLIFSNLKIISFDDLKKIDFKMHHLFTMRDSIYSAEMIELINKYSSNNCHTQIKIPSPYEKEFINKETWTENFAKHLGININEIKHTYAKPKIFKKNTNENLIGINYIVPKHWESKRPSDRWIDNLKGDLLTLNYQISIQPEPTNLKDYVKWINSCTVLITVEGLGLHIGLALRKKVILLSGPVKRTEYLVDNLKCVSLKSSQRCKSCKRGNFLSSDCQCMDLIDSDQILSII